MACLCTFVAGCRPDVELREGTVAVDVLVVDGIPVKSLYDREETDVRNLSIALYDHGALCAQYYFNTLDQLQLQNVTLMRQYTVYALANVGEVSFPGAETDIPSLSVGWSRVSGSTAWPMAFSGSLNATPGAVLSLRLERLVARFDLTVDASGLSLYRFTAQSVTLKSGAGDCRPFIERSVPLSGSVQPDAASAADVAALNAGGATSYYLLESCFGDLLPNNRDAWNKVPSQLSSGLNPPYVEIAGLLAYQDNSGTQIPVKYRFYLGQNATRNFDVVRNTVCTVTLQLRDDNVESGSWKVETGPYEEKASLSFARTVLNLPWMTSAWVAVNVSPSNLLYRVYEKDGSMSDAGLAFQRNGNRVYITSTREGAATGTLYAGTPDGRLERSCRINVVEPPVTLKRIVLRCVDSPRMEYIEYQDKYEVDLYWDFCFEADLYYSDGSSIIGVTDFSEFEWVIADEDMLNPYGDAPNRLFAMEPGLTTAYIRQGRVCSNTLNLSVYSPYLSVRAVPERIECGSSSTLIATMGGREVIAEWEIVDGAEYGYLEDRIYMTFISNGTNKNAETIVIAGHRGDETATCAIELSAPEGGSGNLITHGISVTPPSASIDYDGSQDFRAYYLTWKNGVLTNQKDVSDHATWKIDDTGTAHVSGRGRVRGRNTDNWAKTVGVTARYAGCEGTASLTIGPAPVNPDPTPGPEPGPDPDPDGPMLTGITLSLDKVKIWYGEGVTATVTAWYDDGSHAEVTNAVSGWPVLQGCTREGAFYRHWSAGLRSDARRSLSVEYASFGATCDFTLARQYTVRVDAMFPATLSQTSGQRQKPGFRLVFNDGDVQNGHSGDMDAYTVDGVSYAPSHELYAGDLAPGVHVLTVYVYAENQSGARVLMSGATTFTVNP